MKTQSLLSLIMMSSLLTLVSCGGGSQSEAKLEISKAFVTDGLNLGSGGLLIHGSGPNNQIFTFALDKGTLEKTVKLDNGLWSFYAVGWDGASRFSGNAQCAMAKQDISTNATIDLTIKAENCNEAFNTEVAINELKTLTCGSFKTYNSLENKFYDLTVGTPDAFCSTLPMGLQSELPYYKIVALESTLGNFAPSALESSCLISSPEVGNASLITHFPVTKFPVAIKAFRSEADCLTNNKHQIFHFPKGIHAGNPQKFDHLVFKSGTSPAQTRLILPSSITKRGTSLFENILPQFLCGTSGNFSDCFKEPTINFHIFVNWWEDSREHLLEKNTNMPEAGAQYCSGVSDNGKFSYNNCRVDDGNLYGQVKRKEHLYCQGTTGPMIIDVYSVGNSVYKLIHEWNGYASTSKIIQYNELGQEVSVFTSPNELAHIAVDQSGMIYGSDAGSTIYNLSTNQIYTAGNTINDIHINGPYLYAALSSGYIESFSLSTTIKVSSFQTFMPDAFKLQSFGNGLYFSRYGMNEILRSEFNPLTGLIFGTPASFFTAPASIIDFTIRPDGISFVSTDLKIFQVDNAGTQMNFYSASFPTIKLASLGPNLVGTNLSSSSLDILELAGTVATVMNPTVANCEDTIFIGSKSLNILSTQEPAHIESFSQLVRTIGLRNIANKEHPYYVFDDLQRDHEEVQEGGGYLSDIQSDFSSTGLFSLIRTHKTCEELATAAKVSPVKTQTVVNHYLEGKTFVVDFEITPSASPLPFCLIAGPSCLSDIKVKASITLDNVVEERLVADIKCGVPAGRYEAFYFDKENEEDRELLLWNTLDMATAEFEYYSQSFQGPSEEYREVIKAKKTSADAFWIRHVDVDFHDSYSMEAQVTELEGDGTNIMHISTGAMADQVVPWNELLANTSMSGEDASSCFAKENTVLLSSNMYCTFSDPGVTQTSNGVQLKVDALINPSFLNIFSLQK